MKPHLYEHRRSRLLPRHKFVGRLAMHFAAAAVWAFLIVAGVLFAPVIHRLMHQLHWSGDDTH